MSLAAINKLELILQWKAENLRLPRWQFIDEQVN